MSKKKIEKDWEREAKDLKIQKAELLDHMDELLAKCEEKDEQIKKQQEKIDQLNRFNSRGVEDSLRVYELEEENSILKRLFFLLLKELKFDKRFERSMNEQI